MERLLCASIEPRCSSALAASTSSSATRASATRAKPRGLRARPQRRRSLFLLAAAKSTSSSSSLPSLPSSLSRSISIATRSLKPCARPVRVSASSEEIQGAGGEPPTASSSSTIPSSSSTPSSSSSSSSPPGAALAAAAATLGVVLFAVTRLSTGGITLADVAALSVPLDAALSSGRPTIIEFYADYCDVCKALAPDSAAVARKYGGGGGGGGGGSGASASTSASSSPSSARSLNFVLLNADNARWSPEVAEYGVRGVPHFVFLGADGAARGAAVGRLPPGELEADAADLVEGRPLSIGSRRGGSVGSAGASSPSPTSSSGLGEVTLLRGDRSGGENLPAPRAHG